MIHVLCHWICACRGWDQFEANETLFGVKSTFNEELYTTKLDKGPQMRELEKEALRIAKEIEGEGTRDLHLAEVIPFSCAVFLKVIAQLLKAMSNESEGSSHHMGKEELTSKKLDLLTLMRKRFEQEVTSLV